MLSAACRILARLLPLALLCLCLQGHAAEPGRPVAVPTAPAGPAAALSRLEKDFSDRLGLPLRLFGYEFLGARGPLGSGPDASGGGSGAVQGDYVLGVGDVLTITFRGKKSSSRQVAIDRNGQLLIDDLPPLSAAGLTLAALRQVLTEQVAAAMLGTEVFVSVAELRRIAVLVMGEVPQPGRHMLSGLAGVVEALLAAGGVGRGGSLRRIWLTRAATPDHPRALDLYALLRPGGIPADVRLADGDRITVPPLGAVVAVAGNVRKAALYELAPEAAAPSVNELVALAGGLLRPGPQRALRYGINGSDGREEVVEVADHARPLFVDGDALLLQPRNEARRGEVTVVGHVWRPGPRALAGAASLAVLLGPDDLRSGPYLPFGVLESTDPVTKARVLAAVDLQAVLEGRQDRPLTDGDVMIVLGGAEVAFLTSRPVLDLLRGRRALPEPVCAGLAGLARALAADPHGPLSRGPLARAAAGLAPTPGPCPPLFERFPDLLTFALNHAVLLQSGVMRPGYYPAAAGVALADLALAAGGVLGRPGVVEGGDGPDGSGAEDEAGAGAGAGAGDSAAGLTVTQRTGSGGIVAAVEPRFELLGHVRHPGVRRLESTPTLQAALGDARRLRPGAYSLLAVILRTAPTLGRRWLPFAPVAVLTGKMLRRLEDGDRIYLFAAQELRKVLETPPGQQRDAAARGSDSGNEDDPLADPALLALLERSAVPVQGAVQRPGRYPVAGPVGLALVLDAAGGVTAEADTGAVEITRGGGAGPGAVAGGHQRVTLADAAGVLVAPGDSVRVPHRAGLRAPETVVVAGEVMHPGHYALAPGETLSALLARAGGMTPQAYPPGAVFVRESVRRREEAGFRSAAAEVDRGLVQALLKPNPPPAEAVALARQVADTLRVAEASGRVIVAADPQVLAARPEMDLLLEPGDRLLIPRRAPLVTVSGEVLAPATLPFVSGKRADEYLREAGGFARNADEDRVFVLLPDGRARPLQLSSWNFSDESIPPGATIVVPRDARPLDFLEITKGIGSILSSLALSAASIAVIAR